MSDNTIIYLSIIVGFILLILIIRMTFLSKRREKGEILSYCKLDVRYRKITFISNETLLSESKILSKNKYEYITLTDLELFIQQQKKLPDKYFLIAFNKSYADLLKRAIPILMQESISIIILLPIFKSPTVSQHQKKRYNHQMSDLILIGEFEKYLSEFP